MTENEVLFQISHIVNGHFSFTQAVEQIELLLKRELNGKAILIGRDDAVQLLETFKQPYRSLFSMDLGDEGKLTVLFASDYFQGSAPQRISDFVGEQLGMLLARTRLAKRRAELRRGIAQMEEELFTRKVVQRAEGLLVARRGMPLSSARIWLEHQSKKTGLSLADVADRIITYYQIQQAAA
jgi:ANTAR domain